jgi:hypothetical protein
MFNLRSSTFNFLQYQPSHLNLALNSNRESEIPKIPRLSKKIKKEIWPIMGHVLWPVGGSLLWPIGRSPLWHTMCNVCDSPWIVFDTRWVSHDCDSSWVRFCDPWSVMSVTRHGLVFDQQWVKLLVTDIYYTHNRWITTKYFSGIFSNSNCATSKLPNCWN